MPAISVILPTRHRPHLIGRAVNSILVQTFTDIEVVIVDNNPVDLRIAHQPEQVPWLLDPRVRLIEDERPRNAGSARNLGLSIARGQWVTYLDDDDAYRQNKLERQIRAAESSRLPMGTCGTVYHVPGRHRLRTKDAGEISGDELLLYFLGTPAIFHHRAPEVRFDETLDAGEDVYYFQHLMRHFGTRRIFHVPEALVDIYQQTKGHVNLNARAVWQAHEATLRDFGADYSEAARRVFRDRARLRYCTLERGHLREMLGMCAALARHQGTRDVRLILNCLLCQFPWMRRWLVH